MRCGYERHIDCIEGLVGVMEFCWCDVYIFRLKKMVWDQCMPSHYCLHATLGLVESNDV